MRTSRYFVAGGTWRWTGPCLACGAVDSIASDWPADQDHRLCPACACVAIECEPQELRKRAWWLLLDAERYKRHTLEEADRMRTEALALLRSAAWLLRGPA